MNDVRGPSHIFEVGFGFWASKALLSAVELEVFTRLGDKAITGEDLGAAVGLHPRAIWDFFDALVALGFLDHDDDGPTALYHNTTDTACYLDKTSPDYLAGALEMCPFLLLFGPPLKKLIKID